MRRLAKRGVLAKVGVIAGTVSAILVAAFFFAHDRPALAGNARFVWPATGTITQNAHEHKASFENQYAVDIANSSGGTLVAGADGWVRWGGADGKTGVCYVDGKAYPAGYGNVVTLQHDGGSRTYYTTYGHLSQVYVTSGFVAKGQAIGTMGATGCATGVHVHFQISTCLGVSGNAPVAGASCSLWNGTDYADGTHVSANTGIPADYSGMGGAQPNSVDPGWHADGGWASDIAIVTNPNVGWEKFHVGGSGQIYRRLPGQNWTAIQGVVGPRVAVTASTDGRAELFYIGMNGAVYHHWEKSPGGDISPWESLGGYAKEIAAARSGAYWEVYVVGGDNAIYRATQTNHTWQRMAGTWAYGVAAATSRDGRVELFHIGGGHNVYHAWQSSPGSSFGAWENLGGWVTAIGASSVGNGEYELFAIGANNTIWRQAPWSHTHGWQQIAGSATRVAAARNPDGRVELVAVGGGGMPYHSWQKAVGWFQIRS